jgi:hypothetical protein
MIAPLPDVPGPNTRIADVVAKTLTRALAVAKHVG